MTLAISILSSSCILHYNSDNVMCATRGLYYLVDYTNAITCNTWEGNVTTRREIYIGHIRSLGFGDIIEGVTLRRVTLWRLGRIISNVPMHYTNCHDVNKFSLQKVTYVDE